MPSGIIERTCDKTWADYQKYKQPLRHDFFYSCAYCSIDESEATSIGFQIDHYQPQAEGGAKSDYSNLMWTCQLCNRSKWKYWNAQPCLQVINIEFDDPHDHFDFSFDEIMGLSSIGVVTIDVCDLNRSGLKKLRKIREAKRSVTLKMKRQISHLNRKRHSLLRIDAKKNRKAYSDLSGIIRQIGKKINELKGAVYLGAASPLHELSPSTVKYLKDIHHPLVVDIK